MSEEEEGALGEEQDQGDGEEPAENVPPPKVATSVIPAVNILVPIIRRQMNMSGHSKIT